MLLDIRIQWNAGTACVSECVLKTLACRGLCVGPSKPPPPPKKRGILWTWRFCCRKNTEILGAHKIGAGHFRPQNCGQEFDGHEDFSENLDVLDLPSGGPESAPATIIGGNGGKIKFFIVNCTPPPPPPTIF